METMQNGRKSKGVFLQTVNKTVDVLDVLSETKVPLRATELSAATGINATTIYGILNTLESRGVIEKNPATNTYSIGTHAFRYGIAYQQNAPIVKLATNLTRQMVYDPNLSTRLAILDSACEVLSICLISSKAYENFSTILYDANSSLPLLGYSAGKVLIAYSGDEMMKQFMKTYNFEIDEKMAAQNRLIRENGYALEFEESLIGTSCVAAPIFSRDGRVAAAISDSGATEYVREHQPEMIRHIKQLARMISSELGYIGA